MFFNQLILNVLNKINLNSQIMKSYVQFQVLNPDGKTVVFDRVIADCRLVSFDFGEIVRALHVLFPLGVVVISSKLPKEL